MNNEYTALDIIDKWFSSDEWKGICKDANDGDEDSQELMEHVNELLGSLCFHLNNQSGPDRIRYEMRPFVDLCEDFDIPLWA